MSAATSLMSHIPSEDDAKLAKETSRILSPRLSSTLPLDLREMNSLKEPTIKSPPRRHIYSFRFWMRWAAAMR